MKNSSVSFSHIKRLIFTVLQCSNKILTRAAETNLNQFVTKLSDCLSVAEKEAQVVLKQGKERKKLIIRGFSPICSVVDMPYSLLL